jgi:hypothetical protein
MKLKACTQAPKHKWEWKNDVTLKTYPRPGYVSFSRKGVYLCQCGATKYGMARSGL